MARLAVKFVFSALFLCSAAIAATSESDSSNAVPVRTVHGYLMVAQVFINHQGPFDFLVDTGTNTTLIDPALAKELALSAKDTLRLNSLGHKATVPRYFLQTCTAGPASIANLEALAVPLHQLKAIDGKIRGVLGMNFLLHMSFRLDYDHKRMELYPLPETASIPEGIQVPVQINESRLLVTVASSAAPHGSWQLMLDSGIAQPLLFEDRVTLSRMNQSCTSGSCMMQVSTNLGAQTASSARLHEVSIGDGVLPDSDVLILRNPAQKASDPQDGLVPAAIFHSVFFDRTTATLIFHPAAFRRAHAPVSIAQR